MEIKQKSFALRLRVVPVILLIIISNILSAQSTMPGINFQAIARDFYANPAKDRNIYVEAKIIQNSPSGTVVLHELHKTITDGSGIFSISLGNGSRLGGTASNLFTIDWANGPYFLNLKIAIPPIVPVPNYDYTKELIEIGTSPFGAVPYALYAGNSDAINGKLNISDTAKMLAPYKQILSGSSNNNTSIPANLTAILDGKLNIADSLNKYVTPSQLNAKTFDSTAIYNQLALKANITDVNSTIANKVSTTDFNTALAIKANTASVTTSLATKEDLANKSTNVVNDASSDSKYPSVKAIKNYVDAQVVAASAIADGSITDAKILTVSGSKISGNIAGNAANVTGVVGIANGGTGASSASAARTNLGLVIGTNVQAPLTFNVPIVTNGNTISLNRASTSVDGYMSASDFINFNNKIDAAQKAAINGVATLGNDGKIPSNQIPAISFQSANVVTSQAQMLALSSAVVGSIAIRTDLNKNYVLSATPASTLSNWLELQTPTSVTSVNGSAGPNVVLTTNDVSEGANNKYYTDTRARAAISASAPLTYNSATGTMSMTAASGTTNGYLSASDYAVFNNKQNALIAGVDYLAPNGSAAALTNFPTLNQNTTGNAATATKLATAKNINGVAFDGTANITIAADANTLTGTTLAANIVNSSLTSVGTITSGVWSGTTIAIAKGGTGATTAAAALSNLGAEPTINKSTATDLGSTSPSDILFPSQKAVKTYVDMQSANAGVADGSITNAKLNGGITFDKLAGNIPASKLVGADITTVGTITSGVWSGTTIDIAHGGTGATTAAGARTNLGLVIGTNVMAANAITTLTGDVTGAGNGSIATTVNSIGGVSSATIATLPTSIAANTSSITSNTNSIVTLTNNVNSNTNSITALTNSVAGNISSITSLNTSVVANTASITSNTNSIVTLTNNVNANTNSITALTNSVAANTASITSNINSIATLTTNVNANTNSISVLTNSVAANTSSITSLNTSVAANTASTTANANSIVTLTNNVNANTNSITALTNSVAANTASITSNINSIATLTTNVNANTNSITVLTNSVASNTASITQNIADINLKAPIASPNLTGTPTAPTATAGTNTTQLATTAFVNTAVSNYSPTTTLNLSGGLAGNIPYQTAPGVTGFIPNGTANQFLTATGSGTYTWTSASSVSGVPYTGATGAVNLGAYDLTVNGLTVGTGANGGTLSNTALGIKALNSNTTGNSNTAIGTLALQLNTTNSYNTAVGFSALTNNTTNGNNTAVGSNALFNTSGNNNTAIGFNSGYNTSTSSNYNSLVGVSAGSKLKGSYNIGLGANALYMNNGVAGADNNIAIGASTLFNASKPVSNVVIGHYSGYNLSYGAYNTLLGQKSGLDVTSGYHNTLIGDSTGLGITTGSQNTILGARVSGLSATLTGNVIIADGAGNIRAQHDGSSWSLGVIRSGTWSGTVIGSNYGGAGSVNGLLKANGSGVVSAAIAGLDYMAANATTTLTGDVDGSGNGSFATTVNSVGGVSSATIATLPTSIVSNTSSITSLTNTVAANTISITSNENSIALLTTSVNTLNGNVTSTTNNFFTSIPNLTEVGTITSGVWSGTAIDIAHGGTGATTAADARTNLGLVIGTNVLAPNAAITAATKTKIAYDANGLVTAGADATTADIAASTNRNYVTDAQAGVISNTSGVNTGDETASTIKSKLGITTLSGSNTGDQTITLTGDVTGTGTGTFTSTLANTGVVANTYGSSTLVPVLTVDTKGRITSASTIAINGGVNTVTAIAGSANAYGATISGTALTLTPADASNGGIVTTDIQTFAGAKTFSNTTTFNTDVIVNGIPMGNGKKNLTGNTIIGKNAFNASTATGTHNTVIGNNALQYNTIGLYNTVVGSNAMASTTSTGYSNQAYGYAALYNNTSGYGNSAFGDSSMYFFSTGYNNVSMGNKALAGQVLQSASGYENVAIGYAAMNSIFAGNSNIGIGSYALGKIDNGKNNIGIGLGAGQWVANGTNTSPATGLNNNIFIGHDARPSGSSDQNEIVIGNSIGALTSPYTGAGQIGLGSHSTLIGNSLTQKAQIYGVLTTIPSAAATTASGNSSIIEAQGTTNAAYAGGNVTIKAGSNSSTGLAGNVILTPGISSNVSNNGIVQVNGQIKITGTIEIDGGTPGVGKVLTSDANGLASWTSVPTGVSTLTYSTLSYANGGTISGTTLTLAAANISNPGLMSTASQVFTGLKTFNDGAVVSYINTNNANGNIAFGFQGSSAYQNGTGSKNVAIGSNAMGNWVAGKTGNSNVAIGDQALYGNTTGTGNIALGYQTLYNNTGNDNIAIGGSTLNANTSGYYNIAIGSTALRLNTTGRWNVALGYGSLENNTAEQNTAVGLQALNKNTTGQNDALGYGALFNNTTGDRNTAIGNQALSNNTTANGNVALGNAALYKSTTSPNNVAIGNGAGNEITTDASNLGGNIFIGKSAGSILADGTANSTGYNNIFIGREVMPLNNGDNNEIVIGNYINPGGLGSGSIGLGSNSTSIGNVNTTKAIVYASSSLSNLPATASSGNGGDFTLKAQDAFATGNNNGGNIVLTPGAGANSGTSGQITANGILTATSIQNTPIGSVTASSGKFTSITGSGAILVNPSNPASNTSGSFSKIAAQNAGTATGGNTPSGGALYLSAGDGTGGGNGGDVYLQSGSSSISGNKGSLLFNTTNKSLISTYSPASISILAPAGQDGFTMKHLSNGNNFMNLWQTGTSSTNMITFHKGDNPDVVGTINVSTTATTYNTTSDYRLKTDFKDFSGVDLLSKIKVYDYQWKVDSSRSFGVKAHELQSVIPHAVSGKKDAVNADGSINPQTVDYSKLVPVLIKAVQEQDTKIKDANTENKQLKELIETQKKQLEMQNKRLQAIEEALIKLKSNN